MNPSPTVSFVGGADTEGEVDAEVACDAGPEGDADAPGPHAPATRSTSRTTGSVFRNSDGRFTRPPIRASADAHEPALEDDDDEVQTDPQEGDRQERGEH